jgi:hypothetical protein
MFAVDAWHALIRHSTAHHRRETLAFGRRLNALMERFFLLIIWRNFVKQRSERRPDATTPQRALGLEARSFAAAVRAARDATDGLANALPPRLDQSDAARQRPAPAGLRAVKLEPIQGGPPPLPTATRPVSPPPRHKP